MRIIGASIVLGTVLTAIATSLAAAQTAPAAAAPAAQQPAAAPAPAADPKGKNAGQPVATVNGIAITRAEFDRNWAYFLQSSGIPSNHADKSGRVNEFRQQVLERLVDEELLFQESKRRNLGASTEQVDAEVAKAHEEFPTPEAFAQALDRNGLTEPGLHSLFTRNLSIENLVEKGIARDLTVSDAEVHDFYAGNKASFETPEQVRGRHILVAVDANADEKARQAAKAEAEALLAQIKAGADFEEIARKSSDCPSAPQGGDLGFFRRGQMVAEFETAAFALKPGELSGVVETSFGYHIIRLEERKDAGTVPESEAAGQIREHLVSKKTEEAVEQRLKQLRADAKIELLLTF